LFVTVIEIEAKQYARIEMGGLLVIFERGPGIPPALVGPDFEERKESLEDDGDDRALKLRISCDSGILMA
jgi:hypothetical protein